MSEKYKNKYRIKSHRMPNWDYSGEGIYFITLVTQDRGCYLGKIRNGKIILSDFGKIIENEWLKSFEIRDELVCDEYIIMPNHIHAIILLKKPLLDSDGMTHGPMNVETHGPMNVETHGRASLRSIEQSPEQSKSTIPTDDRTSQQLIRLPKSISSFIGGYKSAINSKIDNYIDKYKLNIPKYNRNNHFFQPNYYDRIVRNDLEYQRIKNYIINNPIKWDCDKFRKKENL